MTLRCIIRLVSFNSERARERASEKKKAVFQVCGDAQVCLMGLSLVKEDHPQPALGSGGF